MSVKGFLRVKPIKTTMSLELKDDLYHWHIQPEVALGIG